MKILGTPETIVSSKWWTIPNLLILLILVFSDTAGGIEAEVSEAGDAHQDVSPSVEITVDSNVSRPPTEIPGSPDVTSPADVSAEPIDNSLTQETEDSDVSEQLTDPLMDANNPPRTESSVGTDGGDPVRDDMPNLPDEEPEIPALQPTHSPIQASPPDSAQASPPISVQNMRSFRVDPTSLPDTPQEKGTLEVLPDPQIVTLSTPDSLFVPHVHNRHGRLLLRTLKSQPLAVRSSRQFYQVIGPLNAVRRVPPPNVTAWNQNIRLKTRPKGKPANGFVFISSLFGTRPNPFGRGTEFHNGIDLVGAKGIPILATAAGKVVSRSRGRGYGIHVTLDHGSGYETLYAHLSRKRVKPNQQVKRGQVIGYLGSTGRSTGPHLHYSVYRDQQAVDPRPYMFK